MKDVCIPKDKLFGELATGSRSTGCPDMCKGDLKTNGFDPSDLETAASDRSGWRSTTKTIIKMLRRGGTADGERNVFKGSSGYR